MNAWLIGLALVHAPKESDVVLLIDEIARANHKVFIAVVRDDLSQIGSLLKTKVGDGAEIRPLLLKKGWDLRVGTESIAVFPTAYRSENFPSITTTDELARKYGCTKPNAKTAMFEKGVISLSKPALFFASDLPLILKEPKLQVNWFAARTPLAISAGSVSSAEALRMAGVVSATEPIRNGAGNHALIPDGEEFSKRYRRHLEEKGIIDAGVDRSQTYAPERRDVVLAAWDAISVSRKKSWMGTPPSKAGKAEILKVLESQSPRVEDLFRQLYKKMDQMASDATGTTRQSLERLTGLRDPTRESFVWFRIMTGNEDVMMPSTQLPNSWTGI